jgi:hypothetical protein
MAMRFRSDHLADGISRPGKTLYATASGIFPDSKQLRIASSVSLTVLAILSPPGDFSITEISRGQKAEEWLVSLSYRMATRRCRWVISLLRPEAFR